VSPIASLVPMVRRPSRTTDEWISLAVTVPADGDTASELLDQRHQPVAQGPSTPSRMHVPVP
jgi:hypothetical protein